MFKKETIQRLLRESMLTVSHCEHYDFSIHGSDYYCSYISAFYYESDYEFDYNLMKLKYDAFMHVFNTKGRDNRFIPFNNGIEYEALALAVTEYALERMHKKVEARLEEEKKHYNGVIMNTQYFLNNNRLVFFVFPEKKWDYILEMENVTSKTKR